MQKHHKKTKKITSSDEFSQNKKLKNFQNRALDQHAVSIINQVEKLNNYKQKLLEERNQFSNESFGTKKQQKYQQIKSSPLINLSQNHIPKRVTNFSIPQQNNYTIPKQNAIKRVKSIKSIIDRLISDSNIESNEVKLGLKNLKKIQNQVIRDLGGEKSQSEYQEIRQTKHKYRQYQQKPTSRQKSPKVELKKNTKGSREETPQLRNSSEIEHQQFEEQQQPKSQLNEQPGTINQQMLGLDDIESKIVSQILSLREDKLNMMKQLNEQIKNSNQIRRENKYLQREIQKLKEILTNTQKISNNQQRNDESDQQNQSFIAKLKKDENEFQNTYNSNFQKIEYQNQKLKEKLKKSQYQISRLKQSPNQIPPFYKQLEAQYKNACNEIEFLKQEIVKMKNSHKNENRSAQIDRNQTIEIINQLKADLQQKQQQIAQLKKNHNINNEQRKKSDNLTREIQILKKQNDQLRANTIKLLKNQPSRSTSNELKQLRQQVERLENTITRERNEKQKIIREMNGLRRQQNIKKENIYTFADRDDNLKNKYNTYTNNNSALNNQYESRRLVMNSKSYQDKSKMLQKVSSQNKFDKYREMIEDLKNIKKAY